MSKSTSPALASSVRIARHYQRSIRLDADLGRLDALDGYVCHGTARAALDSMSRQLVDSNQRAFTWTGPFGGGKSSLAVALASVLGRDKRLREKARSILGLGDVPFFDKAMPVRRGWLVVPVVGKRGSVVLEISRSLRKALSPDTSQDVRKVSSASVIENVCAAAEDPRFDGVLLVIDEMGKFLEASATGGDDVYFFQELAEAAARAPGRVVVVGILHQSFRQYAARLGLDTRDDWAKVQGRYSDIPMVAASDEIVELLARAIETDSRHPGTVRASKTVAESIRRRRPNVGESFAARLDACWPLHPAMAALLGPVSKRQFGQNERSTFGFLASVEPHGFRAWLETSAVSDASWYRPDNYWDFLRANLEPAILSSPDGHRWAQAVEAVERTEAKGGDGLHVSLIKNIAVIDLFRNGSGLAAEPDILRTLHPRRGGDETDAALAQLAHWRVAVLRKHIGAWSIFEGSDFDIDAAVAQARGSLAEVDLDLLTRLANLYPVIAKRHYHETGTLRWMSVALCRLGDAARRVESFSPKGGEFGGFLLVLPDRGTSTKTAVRRCKEIKANASWPVVLGVPPNHARINDLGAELLSLQVVQETRQELQGDSVARREVAARISSVRAHLEEALRSAVVEARWVTADDEPRSVARLSQLASDYAGRLYPHAPRLWSELVNRDELSSNSVKARRDLLYRMIDGEGQENLGIEGYPAERGLYETLLKGSGLHKPDSSGEKWRFVRPELQHRASPLAKLWDVTEHMFSDVESRVDVEDIYETWSWPPFGVRAGTRPVLLTAFLLSRKENVAVYRDGYFIPRLSDADMDECLQDPARFSLRWVTIDQERAKVLRGIASILVDIGESGPDPDPLEAARGLVSMVLGLPQWSQRTRGLSETALAVRDTLAHANDPHKVLFVDLPALLGTVGGGDYIEKLRGPIAEISGAYDAMIRRVESAMLDALDAPADRPDRLNVRAETLSGVTGDLRQDAFAARLAKHDGSQESVEGLLSLAANKPPRDWNDRDIDAALLELASMSLRFRQTESLVAVRGRKPTSDAFSVVIGTGRDARTLSRSFDIPDRDRKTVDDLAEQLARDLSSRGFGHKILLAALARAGVALSERSGEEER